MSSPLDRGAYRKVRARSPGLSGPIVARSDFSGFESSDCALASAAASAAIDSLDRCMGCLRLEDVEADGAGFGATGSDPMAASLPGVLRDERLDFGFGALMLGVRLTGSHEDAGEFGPTVRRTHVDHADALDPRPGW